MYVYTYTKHNVHKFKQKISGTVAYSYYEKNTLFYCILCFTFNAFMI